MMSSDSQFIFLFLFFSLITISTNESPNKPPQNSFSPNIIVIPFKTFFPKSKNNNKNNSIFSSLDYFNNIHSSKIYLNMETKSGQFLRIFISTDESIFYLDDFFSELSNMECPYSCQLSPSYHLCNNYSSIYEDYDIDKAICAKDNFKLYKNHLFNEYVLVSIEFQHYKDKDRDITFTCGKTGLKISSYNINNKGNFISQIHEKIDNVDYSFTLKYTNTSQTKDINELNEGLFIIGIQSFEKKKNVEMDSIYVSKHRFERNLEWKFNVFNILIGNKFFDFDELNIEINPDIDGIEINNYFYEKLKEFFFQTYFDNDICMSEKIHSERYIVIYCLSNKFLQKDIENFPEIIFLNKQIGYNFSFTGKDLFLQIGEKIFFKIITYTEKNKNDIILGKIFIKKYQVIFNSDYKSISFYKTNNNNNDYIEENKKIKLIFGSNKNEILVYLIIYIFIGSLMLLLGVIFGKKCFKTKNKIYANELEDSNYVYELKTYKNYNSNEPVLVDI